jgi:ribosomal-protein-alanine N-acetyltransferase
VIVRPARAGDVAEVGALECELFGPDAWSTQVVEGELTGDLRWAVVATEGDTVIGYAVLLVAAETAGLHRIGVAVPHQGRGVARALLRGLRLDRCPRVLLEVRSDNAAAIGLYESVGFRVTDTRRGYYSDGSDALVMQRDGLGGGGQNGRRA